VTGGSGCNTGLTFTGLSQAADFRHHTRLLLEILAPRPWFLANSRGIREHA
jgi:hypothetical protein